MSKSFNADEHVISSGMLDMSAGAVFDAIQQLPEAQRAPVFAAYTAATEKRAASAASVGGGKLSYKVNIVDKEGNPGKGGVSIYGVGRNPVTLYPQQLLMLAEYMPQLLKMLSEDDNFKKSPAFQQKDRITLPQFTARAKQILSASPAA